MNREKLSNLNERDLLIGLIVDDRFCREVAPSVNPKILEVEYARIVSSWIKEYYLEYKEAPKGNILKIYKAKCDEITDDVLADNILSFIRSLDNQYDGTFNADFMIEQSMRYIKKKDLENLCETISSNLVIGNVDKAQDIITKYRSVEKSSGETCSLLDDVETIKDDLSTEEDILFELPDAFGKVVGEIKRGDFISFIALPKHGKTWALLQCGMEAMRQGCKVLYVSLEMKRKEINRRLWTSLTGRPKFDREDIKRPVFEDCGDGKFKIVDETISRKAYSVYDVDRIAERCRKMFHGGSIRILDVPAFSLSVDAFDTKIEKLIQEINYIPDVLIVDYADIMCPTEKGEYRNQIDVIWKKLRGIAQKRNCVVFTASQSNRSGVNKDLDTTNISEHFGKLAHVTSFVAINQKEEENARGIVRLQQLAVRDGESVHTQAICTQCFAIGRFVVDSKMVNEVMLTESEDSNTDDEEERF